MKRKTKQGQSSKSTGRIARSLIKTEFVTPKEDANCMSNSSAESLKKTQLSSFTPECIRSSTRSRSYRSAISDGEQSHLAHSATSSPARGRRGKKLKGWNAPEVSKTSVDDHSSESRDNEESLRIAASSETEFQNDDDVAPDISGSHVEPNIMNATFAEPRAFEKAGFPSAHMHRKVNKRELKALLKQTKKNRSVLDEKILAEMDKLANDFKGNCLINTEPHPNRPILVATYPHSPENTKRGVGTGRRPGRRSRGRRGGLVQKQVRPVPASWVPLILPNPVQMSTKPSKSYAIDCSDNETDSLLPWLKGLTEARVHRFVTNMRRILPSLSATSCPTSSTNIFVDAMRELGIGKLNCFESTQPSASVVSKHFPSINFSQSTTAPSFLMSNSTFVTHKTEPNSPLSYPSVGTGSTTQIAPAPAPQHPGRFIRGRGRGRHHFSNLRGGHSGQVVNSSTMPDGSSTDVLGTGITSGSSALLQRDTETSTFSTASTNTVIARQNSRTASASKSKNRVSRELRGLVTWDAVMAEQRRRQQEQEHGTSSDISQEKSSKDYDPATAVVTDILAAVEEEDTSTSRARRTRQSSGSILSQTSHSFVGSETASIQTIIAASDPANSDGHYRHKHGETSSTIRSESSIGASSVSSENQHAPLRRTKPSSSDSSRDSRTQSKRPADIIQLQTNSCLDPIQDSPSVFNANYSAVGPDPSCLAKYSPISVEQDQIFQHNPISPNAELVDRISEDAHQKDISKVSRGRRKDRKRKHTPKVGKISDDLYHSDIRVLNEEEMIPAMNSVESSEQVDSLSQPSPTPSTKRRRCAQLASPTPITLPPSSEPHIPNTIPDSFADECPDADANSILHPEETTIGNSLRRATNSRSSALPPRKRYKVGIDNTALDLSPTPGDEISHTAELGSAKLNNHVADDTINPPKENAVNAEQKSTVLPSQPNEVQQRKRGRGRPCRRGGKIAQNVNPSIESFELASEPGIVSGERPKREAADFGFASLVAANLNNSSMVPDGAPVRTNIPTQNPSMSTELPIEPSTPTLSSLSIVPRGRGRPPKSKSVVAPTKDITKIIQDVSVKSSVIKTQDVDPLPMTTETPTESVFSSIKLVGQEEIKVSEMAASCNHKLKVALEDIQTESEVVNESQLSKPANVMASKAKVKPTNTTKAPRGRPSKLTVQARLNSQLSEPKHDPDGSQMDISSHSKPMATDRDFKLSREVSNGLPNRASLFQGSQISDELQFPVKRNWNYGGPTYELFVRFLNEPDPSEPGYRLCAPIIYLPAPERFPEFYRFLIASSVSGLGCIVRFGKSVLDRLFRHAGLDLPKSNDENLAVVEFPSLCIASIAGRFVADFTEASTPPIPLRQLGDELKLSEVERSILAINSSDLKIGVPLLDAAVEGVLNAWEAFAGRRSWLGRRITQLKSVYANIRNEFITQHFCGDISHNIPPIKICSSVAPNWKSQNSNTKKKNDRRALERGAEVIRCLCGFRVEGGHIMVQCDRCSSWQHLPCLWWALSLAIREESEKPSDTSVSALCRTALLAAQAVGSGDLSDHGLDGKAEGADAPYFCPVCLNLDDLTKEYPRSLSAAMNINSLDSVFSLQEATVEGEHEFWTLATPDGSGQIQTDDYAFIHRSWLDHSCPTSVHSPKRMTLKLTPNNPESVIETAYDRVVVRIYRLWKDASGTSWFEGGLFLRPYDLPKCPDTHNHDTSGLWHLREVVYDEASRIILPLSAWSGRCIVLSPSAYRAGCPADLVIREELDNFLPQLKENRQALVEDNGVITATRISFVCDKLFERTGAVTETGQSNYRLEEISPGYLKVNMKPYCFLRKPEIQLGRAVLQRNFTAFQLLELDKSVNLSTEDNNSSKQPKLSTVLTSDHQSDEVKKLETTTPSKCPKKTKGEKLARVVDWLERKLQTGPNDGDSASVHNPSGAECLAESVSMQPKMNEISTHLTTGENPLPRSGRGRPRGSRSNQVASPTSTTESASEVPNSPTNDCSSDRNSRELTAPCRTKRSRISSPDSSVIDVGQPQLSTLSNTDVVPLVSTDTCIHPEMATGNDASTTDSPKPDLNGSFLSYSGKTTNSPQVTSPRSSSDDQSNSSQSKGSSRKRKRSITRRRLALNNVPEDSVDLNMTPADDAVSENQISGLDRTESSENPSAIDAASLADDSNPPDYRNFSTTLQHSSSFLVCEEELTLDLDTLCSCEEFVHLSSYPRVCEETLVVGTACLVAWRHSEVKNQEMLEDIGSPHATDVDINTEEKYKFKLSKEDIGSNVESSPLNTDDPIDDATFGQPCSLNGGPQDCVKETSNLVPETVLECDPLKLPVTSPTSDRKPFETSFLVESVLSSNCGEENTEADTRTEEPVPSSTIDPYAHSQMVHPIVSSQMVIETAMTSSYQVHSPSARKNEESSCLQVQVIEPEHVSKPVSESDHPVGNSLDTHHESDSSQSNRTNEIGIVETNEFHEDSSSVNRSTLEEVSVCLEQPFRTFDVSEITPSPTFSLETVSTTCQIVDLAASTSNLDPTSSLSASVVSDTSPNQHEIVFTAVHSSYPNDNSDIPESVCAETDDNSSVKLKSIPDSITSNFVVPPPAIDNLSKTDVSKYSPDIIASEPVQSSNSIQVFIPKSNNESASVNVGSAEEETQSINVLKICSSSENKMAISSSEQSLSTTSSSSDLLQISEGPTSETLTPSNPVVAPESMKAKMTQPQSPFDSESCMVHVNQADLPLMDTSRSGGNTPLLDEPASSNSVLHTVNSSLPEYLCSATGSLISTCDEHKIACNRSETAIERLESEKSRARESASPHHSSKTGSDDRHRRSHSRHSHNSRDSTKHSSSSHCGPRSEKPSHEHHSSKSYHRRDNRHQHSKSRHRDDYRTHPQSSCRSISSNRSPSGRHNYRDRSHSSSFRSSHHRYHDSNLSSHRSISGDHRTHVSNSDSNRSATNPPKNEAPWDFKNEKESFPDFSTSKQP